MVTIHTENSTYEFDEENKLFRRTECLRGKPRDFDNVWTPYLSRSDYYGGMLILLPEIDKYGQNKFILTSRVKVVE